MTVGIIRNGIVNGQADVPERNARMSFPSSRVSGRHYGYLPPSQASLRPILFPAHIASGTASFPSPASDQDFS